MTLPTELRRTYHLADVDPSHPIRRAADELERLGAERDALRAERDALKAARIAYASEFPPNADGEPDVGNIHANIRLLKKQCDEAIRDADTAIEIARRVDAKERDMLRAERDALRALLAEARCALSEVRAHMHAAGRRPEECYEMSVIDDALRGE